MTRDYLRGLRRFWRRLNESSRCGVCRPWGEATGVVICNRRRYHFGPHRNVLVTEWPRAEGELLPWPAK